MQFFFSRAAYEAELGLYSNPDLQKIMPRCFARFDNADGSLVAPDGFAFPPVIAIERGESLSEFAARVEHEAITIVQALVLVVKRVQVRYEACVWHGRAYRARGHYKWAAER